MLDWQPPHAKWFVGGTAERQRQLPRPPRPRAAPQQGRDHLGRRARRSPDADLLRSAIARCRRSPTCSSRSASKKGDRVAIYMPLVPELADRDARLRAHRRRPQRRVRRLQRRVAARSHQRRRRRACSSPPTAATGAARSSRSRRSPTRRSPARRRSSTSSSSSAAAPRRCPSTMKDGRDHWYHELMAGRAAHVRARADGRRGHALHPLHVRHDREAEGHRAHDRRLPGRHLRDDEAGLRSAGRRRLLVHRRHRLGHRPQLRRLRPARERRDGR